MADRGDIRLGDTIHFKFTSIAVSTAGSGVVGAPFTLAGTPVVSAYPAASLTQITAGITLTVDFDGVTGLNHVTVVASSGNGYLTATNYDLVITTGTVNSVSAVGYVVGSFSIENRSALRPTTAGNTLDVSAGGEAGLDWANMGSKATVNDLSNTTVKTVTSLADGAVTALAIADNAIDAAALSADVINKIWATNTLTEAYAADGAAATPAQLLYMLWSALAEFAIIDTTVTAKKLDGVTAAMTFTLDSATAPTSRTRAT